MLTVFFVTINGQKKIENEIGENLNHGAVLASCKQVIGIKMPFPPDQEFFYIPTKLINKRYLPCAEI